MRNALKPVDVLILGPIALLPWLFAGVELWAFRTASLSLILGACWVFWHEGLSGVGLQRGKRRWLLPAFLLAMMAALQLVPLPAAVHRVLNPHGYAARSEVAQFSSTEDADTLAAFERFALARHGQDGVSPPVAANWSVEVPTDGFLDWYPTSLYPAATQEDLAWYIALLAAFFAIRGRCQSRRVRSVYLGAIGISLTGIALASLLQKIQGSSAFYGIRRYVGEVEPFGPYVNKNNFSAAMELAVPLLIGIGWTVAARALSRRDRSGGPALLAFCGAALCFGAAAIAASKAAAILIPTSVVALLLLATRGRKQRRAAVVVIVVFVIAAIGAFSLTEVGERMQSHLDRSEGGVNIVGRTGAWLATLDMVADYPVLGIGYGAYSEAYPRYTPPGSAKRWNAAHNDYLEVAAEGGILASLLVVWLVWAYGAGLLPAFRGQKVVPPWRWGGLVGLAALALHAFVDFNLQIPANALLFVAVATLLLPRVSSNGDDPRPQRPGILAVACVLVLFYGLNAFNGVVAGVAYARATILEEENSHRSAGRFYAIGAQGANTAEALRAAAERYVRIFDAARSRGLKIDDRDRRDIQRAARYYVRLHRESPASARPLDGLGRVYERLHYLEGNEEADPAGADPARVVAAGLYHLTGERAPNWYAPMDRLALMQWRMGLREDALETVGASARVLPSLHKHKYRVLRPIPLEIREAFALSAWETMRREPRLRTARFVLSLAEQERLLKNHERSLEILDLLDDSRPDARERAQGAHIAGRCLMALDRLDEAKERFEQARLDRVYEPFALAELAVVAEAQGRVDEAQEIRARLRFVAPSLGAPALDYAARLRDEGNLDPALATVREVVKYHPDSLRTRAMLADLYLRLGDLDQAEAEIVEMEKRGMDADAARLRRRLNSERGNFKER